MFFSIGYVIIDDIVLPDGTTHMGCLGGGSVHAIMGMRVWSDQVGLVAKVGMDFPASLKKELNSIFDMRGVSILNKKTMRAWQNFEADGTRTETFRSDPADFPLYKPLLEEFPTVYDSLQGVHLHCSCNEVVGWVERLRPLGNPFILWEPLQAEGLAEFRPGFFKALPLVDCVSPNLQEASALLQLNDPHDLLNAVIDKGAKKVVIREGAQGSIYADSSGEYIQVPAVRVEKIIDQTGAGNAYCGGLVVGSVLSQDPCDALCRAAVSASFALEQFGALFPMERLKEKADSRLRVCREELTRLN
jgi:sugar/nucleoside kinase (ribokinase family)